MYARKRVLDPNSAGMRLETELTTEGEQALLSMSFFQNSEYMGAEQRIWIWVVLTVPSTAAAFFIYWWLTGRRSQRVVKEMRAADPTEDRNKTRDAGSPTSMTHDIGSPSIAMQVMNQSLV